jgi:hypothetical protein
VIYARDARLNVTVYVSSIGATLMRSAPLSVVGS